MADHLTDEHCAGVLLRWARHYANRAQADYDSANALLTSETARLATATALYEERQKRELASGDWTGGFGEPTPEQREREWMDGLQVRVQEAARVLRNNQDMLQYIVRLTQPGTPIP